MDWRRPGACAPGLFHVLNPSGRDAAYGQGGHVFARRPDGGRPAGRKRVASRQAGGWMVAGRRGAGPGQAGAIQRAGGESPLPGRRRVRLASPCNRAQKSRPASCLQGRIDAGRPDDWLRGRKGRARPAPDPGPGEAGSYSASSARERRVQRCGHPRSAPPRPSAQGRPGDG